MSSLTTDNSSVAVTEQLMRRVRALADMTLRIAFLRRWLGEADTTTLADVWTVVVTQAEAGNTDHGQLLLSLSLAWLDPGLDQAKGAAAAVLRARACGGLAQMLDSTPDATDPEASRVPEYDRRRIVTLGERKTMARTRDRRRLAKLLADPHPAVIRILLANPALTEDDVIRLSARRPVPTAVLREVFGCTRWIVRYRIRLAVVLNPHTPLDIALQLAPHLRPRDARTVANAPDVHSALRAAAARVHASEPLH
jgi:hypothetical protein